MATTETETLLVTWTCRHGRIQRERVTLPKAQAIAAFLSMALRAPCETARA